MPVNYDCTKCSNALPCAKHSTREEWARRVAHVYSDAPEIRFEEFIPLLDEKGWPTNVPVYGTPIIAKLGQTVIHGTIGASQGGKYIDVDLLTRDGEVAEDEPFLRDYTLWIPSGWTFEIGVSA